MEDHTNHSMVSGESSPVEYFKFALVILFIVGSSYYLSSGFNAEYLRWFMAVFMLVFASFKLIGYKMFAMMFAGYDVIAKRSKIYAYAYPFIELGLGILYLLNYAVVYRDLLTLIIFGIGTIGVAQEIKKRSGIHCACLGNVIKLPLSTVSLVEDLAMGLMAVYVLII